MDQTTIIAYSGLAISVGSVVLGAINHKRIRSTCCKRELTASFDIESTTPTNKNTNSSNEAVDGSKGQSSA